jgi:hypothetical protein
MAQPFDYNLQVRAPFESSMQGVQSALGLANAVDQGNLAKQQSQVMQAQASANDALAAQRRLETETAQRLQADLGLLAENPNPAAIAGVMVKYPALADQLKTTYATLSTEQQNARVGQASQVYAALRAGKPEIAQQLIAEQSAAYRNTGMDNEAKQLDALGKLIEVSPETAVTSTGMFLASAMGAEKFTENFSKLESERRAAAKEPAELTEAQAKAAKAATEAKFAESAAAMDIAKKGWDITKIQEDIKIAKENQKIAAASLALQRTNTDLQRQELQVKLDQMKLARDTAVREKSAEIESARSSIDNLLNTADRVLTTPLGVVESATGPISSRLPTASQDTADFEELVNTIGSQAFLAQIPAMKGLGALSNAEGEKLQAALQSFSLRQSPDRLLTNVREAQRIMLKARANLSKRYGVPETIPDTPAAAGRGASGTWNKGAPGGKPMPSTDAMLRELGVMQ